MSTLTGPGCPSCEWNDENPIIAFMYPDDDERGTTLTADIVGYEVRCQRCGTEWDEWLFHEYGIVR